MKVSTSFTISPNTTAFNRWKSHEQLTEEDEIRVMENWRHLFVIPEREKEHKKEFIQLQSEFEGM